VTYRAEPYLYVTDQILTALTGGRTRERHLFFAGANSFSFETGAGEVIANSVRVIGQASGEFFSFTRDVDFELGPDGMLRFLAAPEDPSRPQTNATWPDEATEFFVGYYHQGSAASPLTDRNVGSMTRTLGEAFARELATLSLQLEKVYESGFVDTAEGAALDRVVSLLGISRKTREYASGSVRFFRDRVAPADIFVPAGTKVSTAIASPTPGADTGKSGPVAFVTTEDRTLRRGQLAVEVAVRAEDKGPASVVPALSITVVNQPILGISGVMNDAPTVFGGSGESDDELRRRTKLVAERAGRATPGALTNALTELGKIRPNDIKVVEELQLRPGVVQVFVAAPPSEPLAVAVHDALRSTRAAGIRVEHNLEAFLPAPGADSVAGGDVREPASGAPSETTGVLLDDFSYPLCAEVMLFPENPRITGAPKSALEQAVRRAVVSNVEASAVGGVVIYNRLAADIADAGGVLDFVLDIAPLPATPAEPCIGKRNVVLPEGRRAVIDGESNVKVGFAGAPVFFDFLLMVGPEAGDVGEIRKEVRNRLAELFEKATSIEKGPLVSKLSGSELFTITATDLSWIAEYDQAGLIIKKPGDDESTTPIGPTDRPVLRQVRVERRPSP
jgi:uncharacterized phage protein gp47/JayE